jgi:hypothetical protein
MFKNFIYPLKLALTFITILMLCPAIYAQSPVYLHSGANQVWRVTPESSVTDPAVIAQANFDDKSWVPAIVPGTVFASYVAAGQEKDPNFGDNIYKVDKTKYDRNFWYRTEVKVPAIFTKEKIWLCFNGINRKADIYLNGKLLGKLDGFMHRGQYDVTNIISKKDKNILTILVQWPQPPLGNLASPSYISSGGWDWMPYVPGLNMGITDKVFLTNTGTITLHDPWVQSKLPTNARADISVALEVQNHTNEGKQGTLTGTIMPGNITFSQKVFIGANGTTDVKMDKKRFAQLAINSPKLWWPNGYGEPNLYNCKLKLTVDNQTSDEKNVTFGIKRYSYDTLGHVLHVAINGTKVFIKGGSWGISEYMLRCRGDEYDTKVKYHKEMNFNMIRNWIGSVTDDEFYEACDKYGIMVWDDFWLNANPNLPRDLNVFNNNVIEKLKRLRNHPAIAVWCADNEGWPEPPLSDWLKANIATFDGGDRYYQPNSHAENLTGSGPWMGFDPRYYYTAYPDGLGGNRGWGMRSEIGTAVFPNIESLKKFMPQDKLWPRNEMWNQHFFGPLAFNAGPDLYDHQINTRYGKATSIGDYCRKAQLLNIEINKAMYEGWQDRIWEDASGIMTWMSQSSYPSMVWQTYDYYYDLTGAYWGAKKACEPLHIQWNPVNDAIKIINTSSNNADNLVAEATVYNLNGKPVKQYGQSKTVSSVANTATEVFTMDFNQERKDLAKGKPVFASSTTYGEPAMVNDGKTDTRWSSGSWDNEWIYVDLGQSYEVNGVGLNWEDAYAKSFKIQVSTDEKNWKDVYKTTEGQPGEKVIQFEETTARYVRMQGMERGTYWGYSLWNFEVYEGNVKSKDLTDVHFIKLKLKNGTGKLISDNFYWRGNTRKDFTALNSLPRVNLKTSSKTTKANGTCTIKATIANPASSAGIAFGIRVQALKAKSGEQILPVQTNDNYFSLMPARAGTLR